MHLCVCGVRSNGYVGHFIQHFAMIDNTLIAGHAVCVNECAVGSVRKQSVRREMKRMRR